MKFVIDAYAWIEYFDGSPLGEKVRAIVENRSNAIYTNAITLAEIAGHFARRGHDTNKPYTIIASLSKFSLPSTSFSLEAGKLYADMRKTRKHIGLADIFVLLTARKLKAKVVTGDEDFRGLKNVVMLK